MTDRKIILALVALLFVSINAKKLKQCKSAVICEFDDGTLKQSFRKLPKEPVVPTDSPAPSPTGKPSPSKDCGEPGWWIGMGGYQYRIFDALLSYNDAQKYCSDRGGTLPIKGIKNKSYFEFLKRLLAGYDHHGYWLPLTDEKVEGSWRWEDGTRLLDSQKNWAPGQPDNWNNADCSYLSKGQQFQWDDAPCHEKMYILCEKKM